MQPSPLYKSVRRAPAKSQTELCGAPTLARNGASPMEIRDLGIFLDYFGKVHHRTMRVVRCNAIE